MTATRIFAQPSPVLDFIWYPTATPHDPASFCFLASVRECPVKLLDAADGRLRASYRIVDHRERQIAPHSLTFNLTAQKLYCGFEDAIEVFDLSRPGEGTRLHTTPSKKSKDGLKGIISALAFSPSFNEDEAFYAAGSFSPGPSNIAMFSDAQDEPIMYAGGGPSAGVTQLKFNPVRPHILYAAYRGRGTGKIYSWDVRSNLDAPLEIFQQPSPATISQDERTNQRMAFDIDISGKYLSRGDQHGKISIFDLEATENHLQPDFMNDTPDETFTPPALCFGAHDDAIGSVSFCPTRASLLSVSGSRHFFGPGDSSSESSASDGEEEVQTVSDLHPRAQASLKPNRQPASFDASIKIWDFGPTS